MGLPTSSDLGDAWIDVAIDVSGYRLHGRRRPIDRRGCRGAGVHHLRRIIVGDTAMKSDPAVTTQSSVR